MQSGKRHPALNHLAALIGAWEIEGAHQALPGEKITGKTTFEWLTGELFIIWRTHYDHPAIPDSIAILGCDETGDLRNPNGGCTMHYFDKRGVTRLYSVVAEQGEWRYWRDAPGFSQRYTGTFSSNGRTVEGVSELNRDGSTWERDMVVTLRKTS
jgi:hypothetical protein